MQVQFVFEVTGEDRDVREVVVSFDTTWEAKEFRNALAIYRNKKGSQSRLSMGAVIKLAEEAVGRS